MSKFQTVCLIQTGLAEEVSSRIYESFPISVGRSSETAIGIADPGISRNHAELRLKKGQIYIVDMGSANGTYFNGERLEPQTPQLCGPEDLIELGTNRVPMRVQPYEKAFERKQITDSKISGEEKGRILGLLDAAHAEIKRLGETYQANQAQAQANHEQKIATQIEEAREEAETIIRDARARAEEIAQAAQEHHDSVVGAAAGDAQATVDQMIREATEQSETIANSIIDQGEAKLASLTETRRQEFEAMMNEGRAQMAQLRRQLEEEARVQAATASAELESRRLEILGQAESEAQETLSQAQAQAAETTVRATERASQMIALAESQAREALAKANAEAERVNSQTEQIYQAEVDRGTRVVEELKLRTEQEMFARVEQSQVMLKNAVEKSTELMENAERVSKTQLEDAERKSTAMLKVAREDSTALLEKTQKDILEQFTKHQNEMRQLRADTENDLKDTVQETQSLKELVNTLTGELGSTEAQLENAKQALKKVLESLASKEAEDLEVEQRIGSVDKQVKDLEARREKLSVEFAELQKRHADVVAVIQSKQHEWESTQAQIEAQTNEARAKARDEIAAYREREMAAIDKVKLEQLKTLETGRGEEYERINAHRSEIVSEVLKTVEGHFLAHLRPVLPNSFDWSSVAGPLHADVKSDLEQKVYDISRRDQPPVETVQLSPKQQLVLKRSKQGGVAVALMLAIMMLIPSTRAFLLNPFGQQNSAADRYAQEMQTERERRYQPEKTRSWKETYTDSVLYTEGYVNMKLDSKSQEKWIRDLHSYLYGKLRVDEDSIIKIVSLEAALVTNLNEQAGQIHPDYVAEKTARMRETEGEALVEIKKLLGKEQNFDKFQNFSRDYYYNEFLLRVPASDNPEKKDPNPEDPGPRLED